MEMTQNGYKIVIGIYTSKAKLDVADGSQGKPQTIDNNLASIKKLITAEVDQRQPTLVVVEATGGYETPLVKHFKRLRLLWQWLIHVACETLPKESALTLKLIPSMPN